MTCTTAACPPLLASVDDVIDTDPNTGRYFCTPLEQVRALPCYYMWAWLCVPLLLC